jgi:hypothetical protein
MITVMLEESPTRQGALALSGVSPAYAVRCPVLGPWARLKPLATSATACRGRDAA